eukprot:4379687-Pyramimonas_sp.AAC.1
MDVRWKARRPRQSRSPLLGGSRGRSRGRPLGDGSSGSDGGVLFWTTGLNVRDPRIDWSSQTNNGGAY